MNMVVVCLVGGSLYYCWQIGGIVGTTSNAKDSFPQSKRATYEIRDCVPSILRDVQR
jgi:hypothetical protein